MTEAEWRAATDPEVMFDALRDQATDRKLRCFALACLPVVAAYLHDERCKQAVRVLEQFADGGASFEQFHASWEGSLGALDAITGDPSEQRWYYASLYAADSVALALNPRPADNIAAVAARCCHALVTATESGSEQDKRTHEQNRQIALIRDIFGNPFRPASVDPSWLTSTVVILARQMYDSRDFGPMPVLADALEEAGCANADLLDACRTGDPDIDGTWVLQVLLGKV